MNESCNITGTPCRASQSRWRAPRKWLRVCSSTLRKCVAPSVGLPFFFFLFSWRQNSHTHTHTHIHAHFEAVCHAVSVFLLYASTHTHVHTHNSRPCVAPSACLCVHFTTHAHTYTHTFWGRVPRRWYDPVMRVSTHTLTHMSSRNIQVTLWHESC